MASLVEINIVNFDGTLIPFKKPDHKDTNSLSLIKEIVCYNQGELAQYSYLASQQHKDLKTFCTAHPTDIDGIKSKVEALDKYLNESFLEFCSENFRFTKKYFEGRSPQSPRVCLKGNKENSTIVDLARDREGHLKSYDGLEYDMNSNSGFAYVAKEGSPYLCNDIPDAAKKQYYLNPRLNQRRVLGYTPPWNHKWIKHDQKWIDCWNDTGDREGERRHPFPDECYKSTAIVPLTFLNNRMLGQVKEKFEIKRNNPKSIYGYLCMDHPTTKFFNLEDFLFAYIVADMLSLYLITQEMYTDKSDTYMGAHNMLRRENVS